MVKLTSVLLDQSVTYLPLIATATKDSLLLTDPHPDPSPDGAAARAAATTSLLSILALIRQAKPNPGTGYNNSAEASETVICTDTTNPADAADWPRLAAAADRRTPYFGSLWVWETAGCAQRTWTAHDPDAYQGPFTRRTSAPVLIVGNFWDPATPYEGAVTVAHLLPNSRLLSSDNWGHTATTHSTCVGSAVKHYLDTGQPPAEGTVCHNDQPFQPAPTTAPTSPVAGK